IWAFYASVKTLEPSELLQRIFLIVVVVATAYQVIIWGLHIIRTWHSIVLKRKTSEDPSASAALSLLAKFVQVIFIAIIVLIGLENLGVDVTALMAGLGIGGIAVALAAQNILGDLFASLSIVLDKP